MREPIGAIDCPLCGREAEFHRSAERTKLDPDGGQGKPAYPKKFFVVCPPTKGYRGCGTVLANAAEAQARLLEKAHVFGAERTKPATPAPAPEKPAPAPAASAPRKPNPFSLW